MLLKSLGVSEEQEPPGSPQIMRMDWEALAAEFRENGAVLLPQLLDPGTLERVKRVYLETRDGPTQVSGALGEGSYNLASGLRGPLETYRDLVCDGPWADVLEKLWGSSSKGVWFFDHELFYKTWEKRTTRTPFHQDSAYVPFGGEHLAVFWITFEECPKEHSLEVVKGSHRGTADRPLKLLWPAGPGGEIDAQQQTLTESTESWEILSWATKPGDVVVFHAIAIHGGGACTEAFRERNSLGLRFFGDRAFFRHLQANLDPRKDAFSVKGKRYAGLEPGDHLSKAKRMIHIRGPEPLPGAPTGYPEGAGLPPAPAKL